MQGNIEETLCHRWLLGRMMCMTTTKLVFIDGQTDDLT
jgi:hypothetical protein